MPSECSMCFVLFRWLRHISTCRVYMYYVGRVFYRNDLYNLTCVMIYIPGPWWAQARCLARRGIVDRACRKMGGTTTVAMAFLDTKFVSNKKLQKKIILLLIIKGI